MNKKSLFMTMLTALLMSACSQDDPAPDNGGNVDGKATTSYLAVNLVNSDGTSRAQTGYEDGTTDENAVSKVRFYFFNAAGGAVNVKLLDGGYVNYYDWEKDSNANPPFTDPSMDTNDKDDISKKLPAVIVINTKAGDKVPSSMVAVLNPTGLPTGSLSLSQLQGISADYAASSLTTAGSFVMFNSVTNKPVQVAITSDNLKKTAEDAKGNPVKLYVERSVAKVRVGFGLGDGVSTDKILLKNTEDENFIVDGKQVYLRIDGWSLTAETSKGRLVKKVNPAWAGATYFQEYRSCWAINDMTADNMYCDYETGFLDLSNSKYTNENAQLTDIDGAEGTAKHKTKVILKGTLIDSENNPFTIVRHLGSHFADTYSTNESENLPLLKKSILNVLQISKKYYYEFTEESGEKGKRQIDEKCLKILIAGQVESENSENNCYVYSQLTDEAKKYKWFASDAKDAEELADAVDEINTALASKDDRPLVWKSGSTYYYYEIKHKIPGGENGKDLEDIGVVRNHIYDTKVTKIAGLGTPVYDPKQKIYPEKPQPNEHYIAAQIMVLSWHVVNSEYELEW